LPRDCERPFEPRFPARPPDEPLAPRLFADVPRGEALLVRGELPPRVDFPFLPDAARAPPRAVRVPLRAVRAPPRAPEDLRDELLPLPA
jgi:hypothetical protein